MRFPRRFILAALLLLLGAGCSPTYVLRAGYEQARILSRREPIEQVIRNPETSEETRRKLSLVVEARDFAAERLGLDVGDSYTTFAQLDSDTLVLVLSAARKDRFEAHTWWFPIVGHVPYKGFFSERKARQEQERLAERGFDTHLRPAGAFSTLGWFNDPLYSSLLRYEEVSLANTVIHELFHNTLFLPGEVMFNESMANFVGARGAIEFFCGRDGEGAERCARARDLWEDERLFARFLSVLVAELEALYAREDLTFEETLQRREEVFRGARREFAEAVRPRMRTGAFHHFETATLSNATLISRRLYYHRLDLFEEVFQRYGGDLPRTLETIGEAVRGSDDPFAEVERVARLP